MRKPIIPALLLFALPAFAQSSPDSLRINGFFVNSGDTHRFSSDNGERAYGGGIEYFASKNLSIQAAVSSEFTVVTRLISTFGPADEPIILPATAFGRLHPIDAVVRYHFDSGPRWKPYIGAGTRYIEVAGTHNWRPEVNAGLTFALTRHLGIDADIRQLYGQAKFSPVVKNGAFDEGKSHRFTLGLGWAF
jgi:outer membrane protein W